MLKLRTHGREQVYPDMAITNCSHRQTSFVEHDDSRRETSGRETPRRRNHCSFLLVAALVISTIVFVADPRLEGVERLLARTRTSPGNAPPAAKENTPPVPLAAAGSITVIVHQTLRNTSEIPPHQREWRLSWQRIGFRFQTVDDKAMHEDIERLAATAGELRFVRIFDQLHTSVQRTDMWRYAVMWLDGGVYADVDVIAHSPMTQLVTEHIQTGIIFGESLPVFDWLHPRLAAAVGLAARAIGLTDLVRLPQQRNCIMVARARHPLMLRTLQKIVHRVEAQQGVPATALPTEPLLANVLSSAFSAADVCSVK